MSEDEFLLSEPLGEFGLRKRLEGESQENLGPLVQGTAAVWDFLANHFSLSCVYTIEYMVAALVEPLLHEKEP